jgi:hypothetical protein
MQALAIQLENTGEKIRFFLQRLQFLTESIMEIPFQGTGLLKKTDIHHLVAREVKLLEFSINHPVTFGDIEQTVPVFTDPRQITLALFALLSFLKSLVMQNSAIYIDCGISEKCGFIEIKANTREDLTTYFSNHSFEYKTEKSWHFLYIFKKILSRLPGSIEINKDALFIFLPMYEYQDKASLSSLHKQAQLMKIEIDELAASIQGEIDAVIETEYVTDFIQPALPLLDLLMTGFQELSDFLSPIRTAAEQTRQSMPIIKTGCAYCSLLIKDLITLDTLPVPHKPSPQDNIDILENFSLAEKILAYRLPADIQIQFSSPDHLPPLRAEKTALARIIINIILAWITEPAQQKPCPFRFYITAKKATSGIVISIETDGRGMSTPYIEHLTNNTPFLPGEIEAATWFYAIQSIIRAMDGKIKFEGNPDIGTTIALYIKTQEGRMNK